MNNNKNLQEADISAFGAMLPVAAVGLAAGGYLAAKGIGSFRNFLANRAKKKSDAEAAAVPAPTPVPAPAPVPVDNSAKLARIAARKKERLEQEARYQSNREAKVQGIISTYGEVGRAVGASKTAAAAAAAARQAALDQAANERQVNKTEAETLRTQALLQQQKNKDDVSAALIRLKDAQTQVALSKIPKPAPTPAPVPVSDSVPDELPSPAAGAVQGIVNTIKKRKLDPEWQIKNTKPIFPSKASLFTKQQIKNTSNTPLEGSFGKPEAEPKAEPKAKPKTEPKAEPKAKPKTEPKAETKAQQKAQPKAETKAQQKAQPKAETKVEPKTSTPTTPTAAASTGTGRVRARRTSTTPPTTPTTPTTPPAAVPVRVRDERTEEEKRKAAEAGLAERIAANTARDAAATKERNAAKLALVKPAPSRPVKKIKPKEPDGLTPEQLKIALDIQRENLKKKQKEDPPFESMTDSTHYYVTSILKNLLG